MKAFTPLFFFLALVFALLYIYGYIVFHGMHLARSGPRGQDFENLEMCAFCFTFALMGTYIYWGRLGEPIVSLFFLDSCSLRRGVALEMAF